MSALKSFQPVVLSVLRIVTAYLFLLHGTAKFFSFQCPLGGAPEGLMLVAGNFGNCRRYLIDIGPVHPSDRVCFVRSDGSRLFYGTRVLG